MTATTRRRHWTPPRIGTPYVCDRDGSRWTVKQVYVVQLHLKPLRDFEQAAYRCPTCGFWHLTHYSHERRVAA